MGHLLEINAGLRPCEKTGGKWKRALNCRRALSKAQAEQPVTPEYNPLEESHIRQKWPNQYFHCVLSLLEQPEKRGSRQACCCGPKMQPVEDISWPYNEVSSKG